MSEVRSRMYDVFNNNYLGSFSAFRSQSFLPQLFQAQKRISTQVGLQIPYPFKFCNMININFIKQPQSGELLIEKNLT